MGALTNFLGEKLDLKAAFLKSCNKYAGKNFLGKKHIAKNQFVYVTYQEAKEYSLFIAKGIIEREFYVKKHGLRLVGLCSHGCPEAALVDFAAIQAEITTVTVDYSDHGYHQQLDEVVNQSDSMLCKIIDSTEITTLFGETRLLNKVIHLKKSHKLETLKNFI